MTNAFQTNAFQHAGFQGGGVTPMPTPTPTVGGLGKKRRRIKLRLKVGDEVFDIFDEAEAERLLAQLRESAEQTSAAAATKAVAKAIVASTPAARERALIPHPPVIQLLAPDYSQILAQQVQAKVDAARVAVEATYRRQLLEAWVLEQDEDDAIAMLLLS